MEMEEVRAAILISTKKAVASAAPMPSIVSNSAGSIVKMRVSSESRPRAIEDRHASRISRT